MAIVALTILAVLIFLLAENTKLFAKKVYLYTYMDDAAALVIGAPVRLSGILIGKISAVGLTGENTENRIIRIQLEVDGDMLNQVPDDSVAAIAAENLLGTKYINIKKGKSATTIKPNGEVKSLDVRDFQEIVNAAYPLLDSVASIVKRLDAIVGLVEVGKGSIGKLLVDEELYRKVLAITDEVHKLTAAVNTGQGVIGKLVYDEALYTDVRATLGRVDSLLAGLQDGQGTAGKLLKDPALYEDFRKTVADVRLLLGDLNAGKGSAGKLLKSDELHKQVGDLLAKIDTTVDRLNAGQGTLGQLMVNPQLYDNMSGLTREMNGLMKDFRSNPKKFLTIQLKLF